MAGIWKKHAEIWKNHAGFWKISRNLEKNCRILEKVVGIWKKWPDCNGHRAGRVSRVLEEEIRHPTRRSQVFGVRTRVRPPEPLDRVIPGRVRAGGAGWAGGQFIWTALIYIMGRLNALRVFKM